MLTSCCVAVLCCLFFVTGKGYTASAPGPDGYGYLTTSNTPYDWVDISSTGTSVALNDDDHDGPFHLGFSFSFYGVAYTQFFIQSNGMINFADEYVTLSNKCPLPDDGTAENIIALMWDDLDPSSGGTVYYQSYAAGSCPYGSYSGACLVVEFEDIPPCCGGTSPASTFEGILFDDNSIVVQFKNSELASDWGRNSTTGIEGNNFAADHGLSYACNTPGSLYAGLAVAFGPDVNVLDLNPATIKTNGCSGKGVTQSYNLINYNNGGAVSFSMNYDVTSNNGSLTGPATVTVPDNSIAGFDVEFTPSGKVGDVETATITAVGGGSTLVAHIDMAITSGTFEPIADEPDNGRIGLVVAAYDNKIWSIAGQNSTMVPPPVRTYNPVTNTWNVVSGSEATFGPVYMHSGCQVADTVYMYANDGPGNLGLYSYNMATNTWSDLTTLPGQPDPANYWLSAGAWVYDDEAGRCYLTGGNNTLAAEPSKSVFVFDPVAQKWLPPLPSAQYGRFFNAAWIVGFGTDKKLCVAGGAVDTTGVTTQEEFYARMKMTQCYSFSQGAWNAENADLGPLPAPMLQMAYTKKKKCSSSDELWLVGGFGLFSGSVSDNAWYYDLQAGAWMEGPLLSSPTVGCGAATLDNELYRISGTDINGTTGRSERLEMCRRCFPWPIFMPAITGMEEQ